MFIDISCGGVIRNNRLEGNGHTNPYRNWMAGSSGIQISDTPNVEVYRNILVGNSKGIGAVHVEYKNLGAVSKCVPQLKNLYVHDNVITQSGEAAAGIDAKNHQDRVWSSWGIDSRETPPPFQRSQIHEDRQLDLTRPIGSRRHGLTSG